MQAATPRMTSFHVHAVRFMAPLRREVALWLQRSSIYNATEGSASGNGIVIWEQPRRATSSRSGKKGMSDAESSVNMQSDKDAQPGGARIGKNSKVIDKSHEQGTAEGSSQHPNYESGGPPDHLAPVIPE